MKMRNKGKVHPFTSSSSSSSSSSPANKDAFSVLKLLPATILALVSVLSGEDREVLAYMITRSLKSTNPPSFLPAEETKNKKDHKSLFHCDCFHCYTSFWFRWDSSPNRELIHQAIEAFEDHLNNGEDFKKTKSRRKDKMGRRKTSRDGVIEFPAVVDSPLNNEGVVESEAAAEEKVDGLETERAAEVEEEENRSPAAAPVVVRSHKGLARKVLPDVMGIFSSRLWSLWSPNV